MSLNRFEEVEVSAYSGFRYSERPIEITYQKKKMPITRILEHYVEEVFPTGERRYRFRVKCEDNKNFILLYVVNKDQWFISTQSRDVS